MLKKTVIWVVASLAAIGSAALILSRIYNPGGSVEGVILSEDADPSRQVPVAGVQVTAVIGQHLVHGSSDAAGAFRLVLAGGVWHGETVDLQFRHPGYQPLNMAERLRNRIYVIRMSAINSTAAAQTAGPPTTLTDVRVRYSTQSTTPVNIGSVAKTFQVVNTGDVPCDRNGPCSPDGKWKAAVGRLTLDAGEGHEFRNVRISCIAGPCPFTRVESDQSSSAGRMLNVSARDWSDTTTFLVEAEVIQTKLSDLVLNAYPAILGREMSFTLPPTAQGPSIEANTNGMDIVYPLGPQLTLSWAVCQLQVGADKAKLFRCELKPGYRFQ